jgi:photosystem II stability/assembly factor-like uncharacterized protein
VSFTDANTGTAVGSNGVIVRTTDGGATWSQQQSGVLFDLFDVSFLDADNGIAVGDVGIIVRTTDSGATWVTQDSGTTAQLLGASLVDVDTASAVGEDGIIVRTTDGGGEVLDAVDVAGTWEVNATIGSDSCGGTGSYMFTMEVTQEGNTLIGESDDGTLRAKIFGNRIDGRGSFSDIGALYVTGTVSADGNTITGSHEYYGECEGSGPLSATRL